MKNGYTIQFVLVELQIDEIWQIANALFTHLNIVIVLRKLTVALKTATTTKIIILPATAHKMEEKEKKKKYKNNDRCIRYVIFLFDSKCKSIMHHKESIEEC